ncbi:unnamed protein product [Larinioides sclopetarius]|uniref:Uncharacterized protein n=1 Tax=Larinioides sclopetarius TaxID=280406 RepID=A0AAV2AWB9_9ARAC
MHFGFLIFPSAFSSKVLLHWRWEWTSPHLRHLGFKLQAAAAW